MLQKALLLMDVVILVIILILFEIIIFLLASVGLRSTALPNHEDFVLTTPCPNKNIPEHAVMAEVSAQT